MPSPDFDLRTKCQTAFSVRPAPQAFPRYFAAPGRLTFSIGTMGNFSTGVDNLATIACKSA